MKCTPEKISYLVKHYPDDTAQDIAAALGTTPNSIYGKASVLSLTKSEAFMLSDKSSRLDGIKGKSARFPKGHAPWNKGIKGLQPGGQTSCRHYRNNCPPHTLKG